MLFYHSSAKPTAVMGTARIVREAYPDNTAWEVGAKYYDPKSNPDDPTWLMVDIQADQEFARPITLQEIKDKPQAPGHDGSKAGSAALHTAGRQGRLGRDCGFGDGRVGAAMPEPRYWLFKSNVKIDTFESLLRSENQTMPWVGVRNALARNLIRDEIRVGDGVLFLPQWYQAACGSRYGPSCRGNPP